MNCNPEILAPAGNMDSLIAAVRTGANAVYLGGSSLSARQSANSFDKTLLVEAVSYCRARGVKVFQTINTLVFNNELQTVIDLIKDAAQSGIDAFIIQDLAVLELAKTIAPHIQCHASTQLSTHNIEGVNQLAKLGFSRVVLARELTYSELIYILDNSPIEIEVFIHGALCMSMSGGCYISSMIGGRSGNRGKCAQTCRLPFASSNSTHALSLKDLSLIEYLPQLAKAGVASFKIEGRLKRPEYVAAAVTACNDVLNNKNPDYETLEKVFSRSGFTQGYYADKLGDTMFGTRTTQDVTDTKTIVKGLSSLYKSENPLVPVDFILDLKSNLPVTLISRTHDTTVTITGDMPQVAVSTPTTHEKARSQLSRTGGTPFYLNSFETHLEDNLMVPLSQLNKLRRDSLALLLEKLSTIKPVQYNKYIVDAFIPKLSIKKQEIRVRLNDNKMIFDRLFTDVDQIILPINEAIKYNKNHSQIILELPYYTFSKQSTIDLEKSLVTAKQLGFTKALINGLDKITLLERHNFEIYGDYRLNTTNLLAINKLNSINVKDITMSIEYPVEKIEPTSSSTIGFIAYGNLPVMVSRNHPSGLNDGYLVDRMKERFVVKKENEYYVVYNFAPIILSDKMNSYSKFDFYTLYFSYETVSEIKEVIRLYKNSLPYDKNFTRGLYNRKVK